MHTTPVIFLGLALIIANSLTGCAGAGSATGAVPKITNASAVQEVPDTSNIEPIPASVIVTSRSTNDLIDNDLVTELKYQKAFTTVISARTPGAAADVRLIVSSHVEEADTTGESIGQGLAQGLTFGIAQAFQTDNDWFQLSLDASLERNGEVISSYRTTARFETEIADSASLTEKQDLAVKRVNLTYKHALELLVAQIKRDREMMLEAL